MEGQTIIRAFATKTVATLTHNGWGNRLFYLSNGTLDTSRRFTIVTQFLTVNATDTGDLREIRRLYVQDGRIVENAQVQVQGIDRGNSITDARMPTTRRRKHLGMLMHSLPRVE